MMSLPVSAGSVCTPLLQEVDGVVSLPVFAGSVCTSPLLQVVDYGVVSLAVCLQVVSVPLPSSRWSIMV